MPSKIGCAPRTRNASAKRAEVDRGGFARATTKMAEKLKAPARGNRELKQATGGV